MLPLPDSVEDFLKIYNAKRNTFLLDDYATIHSTKPVPIVESKIHYVFGVKYVKKKDENATDEPNKKISPRIEAHTRNPPYSNIDVDPQNVESQAGGDNNLYTGFQSKKSREITSPMDVVLSPMSSPRRTSRPNSAQQKSNADDARNIPRTFSYTLVFIDCKFDKRPFAGIWQIRCVGSAVIFSNYR